VWMSAPRSDTPRVPVSSTAGARGAHSGARPRQRGRPTEPPPYERGFSFFSRYSASSATPDTFTTLNRTPGMSPTAWPFRPKPAISTSSCEGRAARRQQATNPNQRRQQRRIQTSGGGLRALPSAAAIHIPRCHQSHQSHQPCRRHHHHPPTRRLCTAGLPSVVSPRLRWGRGVVYVLIDEVEATVPRHKRGDLLAVFDQLSAHALPDSGVGLLGLDATARGEVEGASETRAPCTEL